VPHAGETTGPETIWDALNELGAERIGHGTSCVQDERLLDHLAEHAIPLEVCPTSNVATGMVAAVAEHPVVRMVERGLVVTINSDDPPMFGTTLNREYEHAADLLGLDRDGVADLARTAVRSSFLDPAGQAELLAEIDTYTTKAS
jgi:aminodeoxyfutalosine deaminase